MKTISVVIADDQALIRSGLRTMLAGEPHILLTGEASDGAELLTLVQEQAPDVLLLDLRMPEVDGMKVIRVLERQGCATAVVVISQYLHGRVVQELAGAGVLGFLDKDAVKSDVVSAVEEAFAGRCYASAGIREKLAAAAGVRGTAGPRADLTGRELQVMLLLCEGKTT